MRHVLPTGDGPVTLSREHQTPPTTADEATHRWHGFKPHKSDALDRLLSDQYMLCCYSELRADLHGLGYHIEHIENKYQTPQRTFDWLNLAACALSSEEGLPKMAAQRATSPDKVEMNFGGHAREKQQQVNLEQFVSVRDPQCAAYFAYLSNGEMRPNLSRSPADQAKANYTIRLLNLNSPYLVTLRRNLWDELDGLLAQHRERGWSVEHLCQGELTPQGARTPPHYFPVLNSFFSLTRQFFGPTAEQTLRQYAPALV
jgi:uncharacterized protein (TIGR02646 family)